MEGFLEKLAYSNLWLGLGASGYAFMTCVFLGMAIDPWALLLPFFAMFMVYTFDKTLDFDVESGMINDPGRTRYIARWRWSMLASAVVLFGAGVVLSFLASLVVLLLFVFPMLVGIFYELPLLPGKKRLKDITGMKSLAVALTWAIACAGIPFYYLGGKGHFGLLLVIAYIAMRFFINTVLFDLADIVGDRKAGIRTIPVALGGRRTKRFLHNVNVVSCAFLFLFTLAGVFPPEAHVVNLLTLYGLAYLVRFDPKKNIGFLCDVVIDGEPLVTGFLALAGLWIFAIVF